MSIQPESVESLRPATDRLAEAVAALDVRARAAVIRGLRPADPTFDGLLRHLWPLLCGPRPDEVAQLVTEFIAVTAVAPADDRQAFAAAMLAADRADLQPFDDLVYATAALVAAINAVMDAEQP